MTETGTQTWHELAERVSDMESSIDTALFKYDDGAPIDLVMQVIRSARHPETSGKGRQIFGAVWQKVGPSYRDDDGTLYTMDQFGNWNAGCTRPNPSPDDPAAHYQNHYKGVKLDPYRIADIYQIPAGPRWQILKKTLRGTSKGQSEQEVINEIRSALDRWQEMVEEDHG